jgi:preprotein translocase subunit YajC
MSTDRIDVDDQVTTTNGLTGKVVSITYNYGQVEYEVELDQGRVDMSGKSSNPRYKFARAALTKVTPNV